jgi:RNA polymerase sigma-70 factor, ECF subfamily
MVQFAVNLAFIRQAPARRAGWNEGIGGLWSKPRARRIQPVTPYGLNSLRPVPDRGPANDAMDEDGIDLGPGMLDPDDFGPDCGDDPAADGEDPDRAPRPSARPRQRPAGSRRLERQDDATLVGDVAQGSVEAFAVLVDRHGSALYRVAARMLGDGHEAEDVVQDCFARLWQHAARWKPTGAGLVGWLHRVTLNLCFDRKRRFRVITIPDLPDMVDETPLADRLMEAEQAHEEIASALAALPERYRAALVLCYLEGFSNAAAADMLGLNIKAMESLLFRARRQLREVLALRELGWRDLAMAGDVERSRAL